MLVSVPWGVPEAGEAVLLVGREDPHSDPATLCERASACPSPSPKGCPFP